MRLQKIFTIACGIASASAMSWKAADAKARKFVADLTNEEKVAVVTGIDNFLGKCVGDIKPIERKNFKGICLQDGPAGPRFSGNTTTWQSGHNTASTFNRNLIREYGKAQGAEFKAKGINIALGPAMGIFRAPAGGRNWEAFGEDPYLTGQCSYEVVTGIQEAGCMATAKHYVLNDQEHNRGASSSNVYDDQTLYEIYLEPFYQAIEAGVGAVMSSYNAINGIYSVQNYHMITEVLKEDLEFQGFVMSDWWAIHDTVKSFNSGNDMNMAGGMAWGPDYKTMDDSFWGNKLIDKIKDGSIRQSRLDDAVLRIFRSLYKLGQMENYPDVNLNADGRKNHAKIQLRAAQESHVLLKNEDNILPLGKKVKKIAVIGDDSLPTEFCEDNACAGGNVVQGWGSGTTNLVNIVDPLSAIQARAKKSKVEVVSYPKDDAEGAAEAAADADVAIVFVKAHSGEEYKTVEGNKGDRNDLDLWFKGNELVAAVAKANKNVVVVIHGPGVVNLPFNDDVKAIVFAGYPGQESGNAISSILFGDFNPSGHLPFTWGKDRKDYCCDVKYPDALPEGTEQKTDYDYSEGLYVGYRWFDKKGIEPLYPFGHGLSYTTFKYSNLNVKTQVGKNDQLKRITATFTVKNTGKVSGAAVPMLFLSFPDTEEMGDYPIRNLKGFEKVVLKPGQSKKITINVNEHELSYYSLINKEFTVPTGGEYTVYIGSNARDLPLKKSVRNPNKTSSAKRY